MHPSGPIQKQFFPPESIRREMLHEDPRIQCTPHDLLNTKTAIAKNEISTVINNSDLFFSSYCIARLNDEGRNPNHLKNHEESFNVSQRPSFILVTGYPSTILEVTKGIEKIRNILEKSFSDMRNNLIEIHHVSRKVYARLKSRCIPYSNIRCDIEELMIDDGIEDSIFNKFIAPHLKTLGSLLKANFIFGLERRDTAITNTPSSLFQQIQINWSTIVYYTAPIPLKIVPPVENEGAADKMYSHYKNNVSCDLKLIATDGELAAHINILYERGGNVIKTMLLAQSESFVTTIHMKNCSLSVARAFVDFVYLGTKGIPLRSPLPSGVTVLDLLDVAYGCENQSLIDHCTNFIRLHYAQPNHASYINHLAHKYNNDYLMQLSYYLSNATQSTSQCLFSQQINSFN